MIQFTKTFLPPKKEYERILEQVWDSNQISNGGKLHQRLIRNLKQYLGVYNIVLTANGTLPLQIALKALASEGEVITTPFSYVATTSSIVWENCKPVFVDIDPKYLTIDEQKIEEAITDKTTAILATHVFGNPCDINEIAKISKKYNLKVIYDAAHAFGVKYNGQSIFNFGDISTCSFHATKLFHTGEGGALFCEDENLYQELFFRHNFGHRGKLDFQGLGINAKMSELQAGMGLAVLPYVEGIIEGNNKIYKMYDGKLNFDHIRKPVFRKASERNFSYYPVIFPNEQKLLEVEKLLNAKGIYPRRYFHPSLNKLPYIEQVKMPVSEDISSRILCLPLYPALTKDEINLIANIINSELNN